MKARLLGVLFGLLGLKGLSQNGVTSYPGWQIKPVYSKGFVLIHRATIGHLVKGYPDLYEFNLSKPTIGNKLWHQENNFPNIGVTFHVMDFKNPNQLGYAFTAAPYVEIPLKKEDKWWRLSMRMAWGASYLNKKFDITTNSKNIAIGSHVNAFVQFRWMMTWHLNEFLTLEPGLTFTHYSNGHMYNPNLGLNVVGLGTGLNILLPKARNVVHQTPDEKEKANHCKKNELLAMLAFGLNQRGVADSLTLTRSLQLSYHRRIRNTHTFILGTDIFYDDNYRIDYRYTMGEWPKLQQALRVSLKAGYAYNIGQVSVPIEIGYYVFQKFNPDAVLVTRLGVRYYHPSGLSFLFGLRTHYAVAYNFELGVGYRLPL